MVNQLAQFSPLDAATYVQQQGEMGRQRGQQNKLAQLSSQAYSTPADQQGQLLGQMAAIDPRAAQAQQQQFESAEDRRNKTLANMSNLLVNAPEQTRPGLYQQMLPTLQQFGVQAPAAYDANTAPVIDQTAQALYKAYSGSGAGGAVQSTYVDDQGQRVAILRDGSTRVLGGNDAGATQQTLTIDINGKPTQVTFDRRTGRYSDASLPAAQSNAPAPTSAVFMGADGVPVDISQVTDPAVRQSIMAQSQGWAGVPDGGAVAMPPQAGARPLVGRSKEEETAAVEAARQATQLQYLPQELGVRTQAAIQQAAGTERAKGQVEQQLEAQQALPRVVQTSDQAISLVDQALNHPGRATATGLSSTLDPRNYAPGTDARDFQVLLDQIKGGTFLQAFQSLKGGGAITEVEGRKAEQAIARLNTAQSDEAFAQSLKDLKEVANTAKQNAIRRAQQGGGGSRGAATPAPAKSGGSYSDLWN